MSRRNKANCPEEAAAIQKMLRVNKQRVNSFLSLFSSYINTWYSRVHMWQADRHRKRSHLEGVGSDSWILFQIATCRFKTINSKRDKTALSFPTDHQLAHSKFRHRMETFSGQLLKLHPSSYYLSHLKHLVRPNIRRVKIHTQ